MLVKSLTLKRPQGIAGLVKYIFKEESRYIDNKGRELIYNYNLQRGDISSYVNQFKTNLASLSKTTKRVQLYHFILSWVEEDRNKINTTIMRKAVRKIIGLHSNSKGAYLAVAHGKDTPHPHIHVLCGGLEVGTQNKALRISKARFSEIQQEMQLWEKRYFPELALSRVYYGEKERQEKQTKHTEYAIKKDKRTSKKQMLEARVKQVAVKSNSQENLIEALQEQGIEAYYRNNKLAGFRDPNSNRKYRISTLKLENTLENVSHKTPENEIQKTAVTPKTNTVHHKTKEAQQAENQHPQYNDIMKELNEIREIAEEREANNEIER